MTNQPFFSIIVPVYNGEAFIEECIQSIVGQVYSDYELLIVNDGSTDNTEIICLRYAKLDKRIRVITVPNGGVFKARIVGLEQTRGEYVLFLDADDKYCKKEALQIIYDNVSHYDCDLLQFGRVDCFKHFKRAVMHNVRNVLISDQENFEFKQYPILLTAGKIIEGNLSVNVWDKAYSRRLLVKLPKFTTIPRIFWAEDYIINIMLLEHCNKAVFISDILYAHNTRSGGTNKTKKSIIEDIDYSKRVQFEYIERWRGSEKQKKEFKRSLCAEIAAWFLLMLRVDFSKLPEKELLSLIQHALELDSFQKAAHFFMENPENWDAVNLLVAGDARAYQQYVYDHPRVKSLKQRIKEAFWKII